VLSKVQKKSQAQTAEKKRVIKAQGFLQKLGLQNFKG